MPPREVDEVSIRLGEVLARLKAIEDIAGSERETARQHRVDLKAVIDDLKAVIGALSSSVREISSREGAFQDRLAQAEELTHDYRQQRDMARGAAKMVNIVRAIVIFLSTIVATALAYLGMHGGKP